MNIKSMIADRKGMTASTKSVIADRKGIATSVKIEKIGREIEDTRESCLGKRGQLTLF
jgi:hypothetical protein